MTTHPRLTVTFGPPPGSNETWGRSPFDPVPEPQHSEWWAEQYRQLEYRKAARKAAAREAHRNSTSNT